MAFTPRVVVLLPLLAALVLLPLVAAAAKTPAPSVTVKTQSQKKASTVPHVYNRRHDGIPPSPRTKGPICCQWAAVKKDVCGSCHSAAYGKDWCAQSAANCLKCKGTYCPKGGRRDGAY
jgi:hypothetical protein